MPDQIRLKVGGIQSPLFAVYDEFARNIPGFQAMTERDAASLFIPKTSIPVSILFLCVCVCVCVHFAAFTFYV